jgi:UDP-2,3-diacylglucosamine pyrophosphatase LpxH
MEDAVIVSDLHLGSAACQADRLEGFLHGLPPTRRLVLNGDVVESTEHRLNKRHWRILSLLRKLSDQLELVWVAGNHDADAHALAHTVGAAYVQQGYPEAGVYRFTSGGRKVLVTHGDRFDDFTSRRPVITWAADRAYGALQRLSRGFAVVVKRQSKTFLCCCDKVRDGAMQLAARTGADVAICGHTHLAEAGGGYFNCGSWTDEVCHYVSVQDGELRLVAV